MRSAVIGPSRNPVAAPYAGGQERFTAILADGLRARGHRIELWARAGSDPMLPTGSMSCPARRICRPWRRRTRTCQSRVFSTTRSPIWR